MFIRQRVTKNEEHAPTSAEEQKGKEDGGLVHHSVECTENIVWEGDKIVSWEMGLTRRKVREGIESGVTCTKPWNENCEQS